MKYMNAVWLRFMTLAVLLALVAGPPARAQSSTIGAVIGLHGLKTIIPEIGAGYSVRDDEDLGVWHGYTVSAEISAGERTVIGLQAGTWWTLVFLNVGAGVIYYTDSQESALRFRPEIGVGRGSFRLTYGLLVPMTNPAFEGVARQEIAVRWTFPLVPLGK